MDNLPAESGVFSLILKMTNFIPVFPLAIVVYPDEQINLHIFEPKYKQLIGDCLKQHKPFGIPAVVDNKTCEFGTLTEISSLEKTFDNGEMDICIRGMAVFRILEPIHEIPDKLYSGAIVNYPENKTSGRESLMKQLIIRIRELHVILKISKDFKKPDSELNSYDLAHHSGLSIQQEYDLLCLLDELHRQEYLKRHLKKVIPLMSQIEMLKERVKLNGHFRSLSIDNI